MAKSKTHPAILKPVFDPEAALRFAAEGEPAAKPEASGQERNPREKAGKSRAGYTEVTVLIREELLPRARAEAARKGRTLDELIEKLITKHVGKH
jgi:hypothetical protein